MSKNRKPLTDKSTGQGYTKEQLEIAQRGEEILNAFDGVIQPPTFLLEHEIALDCFMFLANELLNLKLYTSLDSVKLAQYCLLYERYIENLDTLAKEGQLVELTNKVGEPYWSESASSKLDRMLIRDMSALGKSFPFSPLDRLAYREMLGEKKKTLVDLLAEDDEDDD
ncbi:MAG: P27 family phage terminase small subunit [Clostridium baratii]|nr:P27 family phage terminase small subunit [Clostridium baratii]